jgi:hypothetical protein
VPVASGEWLRDETLALKQGLRRSTVSPGLVKPNLRAAPMQIDLLEPPCHSMPPSPLGPETTWR